MKTIFVSLAAILIVSLASCAGARMKSSPRTDKFDKEFLLWMSDHLMHDLKIAAACKGKNIQTELLTFCGTMYTDQTQEQARIKQMLKLWFNAKIHQDPYPLWIESQDGKVFEEKFLEGILRDHEEGAGRARECMKQAKHPDLVQFCNEAAVHRQKEVETLKLWNCRWFGHC